MPEPSLVYRHALREATVVFVLWIVCLLYSCSYCYLFGYATHEPASSSTGPAIGAWFGSLDQFNRDVSAVHTPLGLGIPDWVFYGIVVPWLLCIAFTFWFCLAFFVEDDLGATDAEGKSPPESAP